MARDEDFPEFVRGASSHLAHLAWLLTGDRGRAEDLVQSALVRTYAAWPRVRPGEETAYARRVLVNLQHDWWRRGPWRERSTDALPDTADLGGVSRLEDRDALARALATVGRRERTVVVLRYYADLDVATVAALLDLSPSAVRSTASKALAKLRVSTELADTPAGGHR